jgi:F-type H+-transporting ATPase subunit gamma
MPSAREMRLRIRSVKSIAQVTRALQAVSASKVRKAVRTVSATRPYSEKAWHVLLHLASQPTHNVLHPLLKPREAVKKILVVMISSDRGLSGAYNTNIVKFTLQHFNKVPQEVSYVTVGKKGRDLLLRRRKNVEAEFSGLPATPTFMDVSPIGRIIVDDFLEGKADEVYLVYTRFINMVKQEPVVKKLLPLEVPITAEDNPSTTAAHSSVFEYEPDEAELLDQIVPRFTAVQVYQAILEAQASEHAARMIAMRNATDNAQALSSFLLLEYNNARQQSITNEMLDIASGAEALSTKKEAA